MERKQVVFSFEFERNFEFCLNDIILSAVRRHEWDLQIKFRVVNFDLSLGF